MKTTWSFVFKELYPGAEDPLFWIHLNVDYPFTLTGILYFPRLKNDVDAIRKDRIQLYSRQVFITDSVEEIVPDYLMLLQGVIDSPDIPLNVSRSTLQHDSNVRRISNYISKKVAEKLKDIFNEDRAKLEEKWPFMDTFMKYGMVSDEKFSEQVKDFVLLKNTSDTYFTVEEYKEKIKENQTDKDGKLVFVYASDIAKQSTFIKSAENRNYDVLHMNGVLDSHFIGLLERKNENTSWKRVDSESITNLIRKEEDGEESKLSETQTTAVKDLFKEALNNEKMTVMTEALGEKELPVVITRPEFMRRMKDMSATGGASYFGDMGDMYNVIVNTSHPITSKIAKAKKDERKSDLIQQVVDLALLSQNMLDGAKMTEFIHRSVDLIK